MTQKELLYIEDAIGHETTIINVLNSIINSLTDEELVSFIEGEITTHSSYKKDLIKYLKEETNE